MSVKPSYLRANRMFHLDDPQSNCQGWYFEIRDGKPRGSYITLGLAYMALRLYLREVEKTQLSRHERTFESRNAGPAGLEVLPTQS